MKKGFFVIMMAVVVTLFGLTVKISAAVTINPGDLIVADHNRIIKVDPVTGDQTLISEGGVFTGPYDPYGIKIDSNGDLITTGWQSGVTRINPATGAQTTISSGGLLQWPTGIAIAANGDLFIVNHNVGTVIRVDPSSGTQTLISQGGLLQACSPGYGGCGRLLGIAIATNGDLFVTNYDGGIVRVNPTTGAQTAISSSVPYPAGIAIDANGDLIVTSVGSGQPGTIALHRVNPTTGMATLISDIWGGPWGVAIEANGNIIVVNSWPVSILRVNPATRSVTVISERGLFIAPTHVAIAGTTGGGGGNQPPVANGGPDQTVHVGTSVTLDGTGSRDPDGNTPLSFAWSFISKPQESLAVLSNPTASMPSFTADVVGDYTIQLVVTDSLGASSAPDTVVISTTNSAPVADAGPDQSIIRIDTTVQLNGSLSYDSDGDTITYSWSLLQKPQGSIATLSDPNIPNPTFVADYQGDYVVSLVVRDSFGAVSAPDTVTVSFTNVKPVANAGQNQAVSVGQTVFLNGSGSSDANGDPLTYSWSMVSRPASSLADLVNANAVNPSFIADMSGIYVVSLMVNDGFVNSDPASVTITATISKDQVVQTLDTAIKTINALDPSVFRNPNLANALTNKINAVLQDVDQGLYQQALDKLQNDILAKTDGCAKTGAPDKNDWLKDCSSQNQVYPLIIQTINLLKSLI